MTTLYLDEMMRPDRVQESPVLVPAAASWTLSANDEMRIYLRELLEHEGGCGMENCDLCQSAHHVYALVRGRIYSEVIFPGVTIAERGRGAGTVPYAVCTGASFLSSWAA